jgi:hypothetical protein
MPSRFDIGRSWLFTSALTALMLTAVVPQASAKKAVVVMGIRGPKGGQASRLVARALAGRYRLVSRGRFARKARELGEGRSGRSMAARALRVAGIITGSITRAGGRWVLRLSVSSGHSGQMVGSATFPLRGTRLDPTTARRIPAGIARAMSRARAGPPLAGHSPRRRKRRKRRIAVRVERPPPAPPPQAPAVQPQPAPPQPQPAPPQSGGFDDGTDLGSEPPPAAPVPRQPPVATAPPVAPAGTGDTGFETPPAAPRPRNDEDLGFEVDNEGQSNQRVPSYREKGSRNADEQFRISKKTSGRPEWQHILEFSFGMMAVSRNFDFNDPIYPAKADEHSNYRSGIVPAIVLDAAVYPLAYLNRGPLANMGLVGRYYRVLGLKSQPPTGNQPVNTTLHTLELGLRYRWNILKKNSSPTVYAGVEFGRLGFVIWDDQYNYVPLPDIVYLYLKLALVGLEVPFYAKNRIRVGLTGSFDYLLIFEAGEIENTDSTGYGRSSTGGIDIGLGLFGSYYGFFIKVNGFYRRIFYDFDNACYHGKLGCRAAGGALDIYTGGSVLAGYSF